jgi:phospholipase/carboxylesterase
MIVAIHGLGDRPENFAHLFDTFPERARLILPRGIDPTEEEDGWSWFPIRARDGDIEALAAGIGLAADKIAVAMTQLQTIHPTRGKPIVTGFSQGGMLTLALAVHHPEVVGHAVAIGGWLPPPLWPEQKPGGATPSIVALHGSADNAVRWGPTKEALDHLEQLGFAVELRTYEGVRHVLTPEIQRDLFDQLIDAFEAPPN